MGESGVDTFTMRDRFILVSLNSGLKNLLIKFVDAPGDIYFGYTIEKNSEGPLSPQ